MPAPKTSDPGRPVATAGSGRPRPSAPRGALPALALAALAWALPGPSAAQAGAEGASRYREPVAELRAIVDAPRAPQLTLSPRRDLAALVRMPDLPGIDVVAQPELKLAGLRFHPRVHAPSQFTFGSELWLMDVASGSERRIAGLPEPLGLAGLAWSPDQRHFVFNRIDRASGANELWLVDVAALRARRLVAGLNTVAGSAYSWLPDSRGLLVRLQAGSPGPLPPADAVPTGPSVQQTEAGAGVRSIRTFQDLLRNENDALTLEHYLVSQPARVDLQGKVVRVGAAALYTSTSPSPDGRFVLAQRIERPFSYLVPLMRFPRVVEVLDATSGRSVHTVARLPLVEGLPTGNDAVPTGVRSVAWRADAPATLAWAEAQDGGDPAREAAVRDAVFMQAAPFSAAPVKLAALGSRYGGITWGRGDLALLDEAWWKNRRTKTWRIAPDAPAQAPQLLVDRSFEDRYADPGSAATLTDAAGRQRLLTSADGGSLFLLGEGASPEGDRPFVDRYDLATGKSERLFHSQAPYYEAPQALLDDSGLRLLTTRESPAEPGNFYVRDAGAAEPLRALTRFPHPTPQLRDVRKEQIRYKRADGVELTGTLYLPAGYDAGRDGPLPVLMWAYPQEFKSAQAASQVTNSPYRFNRISYWGPLPFLARGFAVLDDPSMPIVGEGDAEPNDTYIAQLTASAQAAVDELARRGVGDPKRVAVGGHSYGAFMTANLLAHTRLFKAGIARSGAYNRTLTPFGFQSEERNFWQAPETYLTMSPFNHADRIKDALLLIHGEQDNNSGTFPIQSERMFAAVKGLGGNARLVMLPNESHGYRARESILHMLAETDDWLQEYVRNATAERAQAKN
ncbi:prolyl oligopeptidase family serine peptidase [Pseudoxanthomonas daejeonensis]|uniref:S9 family peptidase n=1 Tax=Pseudoxanthomonas daejeonensis TaxID=266062 RepID=A0ABQ6Z874_9GAMM|nr:prolyl oligopeptidase family serine peptidase [Pseudoxanthomonas daejeonensis]KAF1695381.1 S9 family peptidase [Pseudoxanthomonas daejeonensis]